MRLAGQEIAIVGAGIGGLAAAIALAQRGALVHVYERAFVLGEVGAGLQVAPNGVAVLEALGLRDAAERRASLPEAIDLVGPDGRPVASVPLGQAAVARYGRPYWHVHRSDLLDVLRAGATEAGVRLHVGVRVDRVASAGDGVALTLADGRTVEAGLVVAADGVRSGVRTTHFSQTPPRFTRHVAWRGTVTADRAPPAFLDPAARVTMGAGRHLVTYPLRNRSIVNFVAVEERDAWTDEGWSHTDDPENLRRSFAGFGGGAGNLLAGVRHCFLWGLFDHAPLPRWVEGGIALLGDACHPMMPFLAQGATMALEDAWVLADCLDLADDPREGLVAYESARRGRAGRVQRAAAGAGRLYHLAPGPAAVAHTALRVAASLSPRLLAGRFDWIFAEDVTRLERA